MRREKAGILPGLTLILAAAVPAWYLGRMLPLIGGPVLGILLGMLLAFWQRPGIFDRGINFVSKQGLQLAIILLGFEMNLYHVLTVSRQSLLLVLFTLSAVFATAMLVGCRLRLSANIRTLIGVGTAICGGSAIAATAPVIKADDREVAYAISTIFFFNILAVFIFPPLGHLLQMSDQGFGIWAGTAINDTSSVVAAGYAFGDEAGSLATIVKLARSLMIVPVTLALALLFAKKRDTGGHYRLAEVFPWFVLGFLAASVVNTSGFVPLGVAQNLAGTGKFVIVMALTAIGLKTDLQKMFNYGLKPILLGLACSVSVALTSLSIQYIFKLW
ncbi:MAG: YeiH family putative sulfate export transporter [Clostridia bacterium]|nr:YeiH family putative sulfate export transporter [Clostridia bacterium]